MHCVPFDVDKINAGRYKVMDLTRYKYVSICGGGMLGRLFLAMKISVDAHLKDTMGEDGPKQWWDNIQGISGCSAGAMAALVMLLRLPDHKIKDLTNLACKRNTVMRHPDLGTLVQQFGLDDAQGLYDVATSALEQAGLSRYITFQELQRYLRKDLVVVATNVERGQKVYMSADTFPDMEVREAVVASCRIPFVYAPKRISEDIALVDGGLTENQPVYFPVESTLNWATTYFVESGFTFPHAQSERSPIDYACSLFACVTANQRKVFDPRHTLYAFCPGWENQIPTFTLDELEIESVDETFKRVEIFVGDQLKGKRIVRLLAQIVVLSISLSGVVPSDGS